jgi:7,8-dihydropterin-6-yl-methyl-4-(beta-D-ribofuranosyl)aminobenzene 5'-phosphate synthase
MRVTCVVDDAVQRNSPFWGEHGLAFLIETEDAKVLFDTGQSGTVLQHNLQLLEVKPAQVDAVAISHAHYDHTGGLPELLQQARPGTPIHASPELFRGRFAQRDGELKEVGLGLSREELAGRMSLVLSPEPQEIISSVWTTGEISERPHPQGSSPSHRMRDGDELVADAYRDDLSLVLQSGDQLMVLCGCCHAGLLNTLEHVQRTFGGSVAVIAGGLHLADTSAEELQHIGQLLAAMPGLQHVYPNHCSGEAAFVALTQILGPSVVSPCPAGSVMGF